MIRINLLAAERGAAKKTRAAGGVTAAQRVTIGAALILLSTLVTVGWWYWSLHTRGVRLDEDIAAAETKAQQLRSVLAQVQKFETRKAQLQQRVTLIEQLRKGQSGPVHILDEVSKALPDRLWLISMAQRDKDFTFDCRTTSLTGVSDFVANLEASGWFKKPVELVDSQVDQTPQGPLVRFTIRGTTVNPDEPQPPPPAGRGAPPAR
jgi:type IV pilus assembly protein PilN